MEQLPRVAEITEKFDIKDSYRKGAKIAKGAKKYYCNNTVTER